MFQQLHVGFFLTEMQRILNHTLFHAHRTYAADIRVHSRLYSFSSRRSGCAVHPAFKSSQTLSSITGESIQNLLCTTVLSTAVFVL